MEKLNVFYIYKTDNFKRANAIFKHSNITFSDDEFNYVLVNNLEVILNNMSDLIKKNAFQFTKEEIIQNFIMSILINSIAKSIYNNNNNEFMKNSKKISQYFYGGNLTIIENVTQEEFKMIDNQNKFLVYDEEKHQLKLMKYNYNKNDNLTGVLFDNYKEIIKLEPTKAINMINDLILKINSNEYINLKLINTYIFYSLCWFEYLNNIVNLHNKFIALTDKLDFYIDFIRNDSNGKNVFSNNINRMDIFIYNAKNFFYSLNPYNELIQIKEINDLEVEANNFKNYYLRNDSLKDETEKIQAMDIYFNTIELINKINNSKIPQYKREYLFKNKVFLDFINYLKPNNVKLNKVKNNLAWLSKAVECLVDFEIKYIQ